MVLYRLVDQTVEHGTPVETFAATEHAVGPWGPMQHGGPVAALLTRAMSRVTSPPAARISRLTVDLLGPIPMGEVRVSARIVRPGRRIELLASTLEARNQQGQWHEVAHGRAWRLATQPTEDVVRHADAPRQFPGVDSSSLDDYEMPDAWPRQGFVGAVDWRLAQLGVEPGVPTIAWVDLTHDLVEGEQTSALERAVAAADTTNGVGARLDPGRFSFLNTELTVHLHHPPAGRWYGLEAETSVGPDGIGMSAGVLHSEGGPIGRVTQNLLIERR